MSRVPGLYWQVHPDARAFVPNEADRARLAAMAPGDAVDVFLWPRALATSAVGRSGDDYGFRAVSRGPRVDILTDATETPASIRWLIAHELGHQRARQAGFHAILQEGAPQDVEPVSDAYHHLDPEERWADGLATRAFGERLDRDWWRARTPRRAVLTTFGGLGAVYGGRTC